MTDVLRKRGNLDIEKTPCDEIRRHGRDTPTSPGTPNDQKLGKRPGTDSPSQAWQDQPCQNTLILHFKLLNL
jgi:hypothetical protein